MRALARAHLNQRGIECRVYERAPEIKELGVGITLLPHAMREFSALGLGDELLAAGIENRESCFFNRFGQLIYKEERGKFAGYQYPEVGIHRGKLHVILARRPRASSLGADAIRTDCECTGVEQDERGATAHFKQTSTGKPRDSVTRRRGDRLRRHQFGDPQAILSATTKSSFAGINTWRGVTRRKPILDGRTYMRVGSILTGKIVIYPIVDNIDGDGNQLINWMAEIKRDTSSRTTGTSRAISTTSSRSTRTGASTGSTWRR